MMVASLRQIKIVPVDLSKLFNVVKNNIVKNSAWQTS